MKKQVTHEQLVALAKLAPKVDWKEPKKGHVKKLTHEKETSSVLDFLDLVDVRGGKYEVKILDLFSLFEDFDESGLTYRKFRKELKKFVKFTKKDTICKLSRKLITIEENFRSSVKDETEEE